jgi:hypothetical protein
MSGKMLELEALLTELREVANEAGASSLSARASVPVGLEAPGAPERRAALLVMVAAALRAGIEARRASIDLPAGEIEARIAELRAPSTGSGDVAALVEREVDRIQAKLTADVNQFKADLRLELPAAVREASLDDLKRHFTAFAERSFRTWLEAELAEIETELERAAAQVDALLREGGARVLRPSVLPELGTRALEVDTFQRDFGVFALSTVGVAVLFSNVFLGGALLVAAPFVARYGRERTLVELRERATEEAARALGEATDRLEQEVSRRIESFGAELLGLAVGPDAPARKGVAEMLERALAERSAPNVELPAELERCRSWQERLTGLLARAQALSPGGASERTRS